MTQRRTIFVSTLLLALSAFVQAADPQPRSISVVGTSQVHVVPDLVMLSIGVETYATKIDEAISKNDERTAKTLELIKQFGIDAIDVQTDELSLSPKYARRDTNQFEYDYDKVLGYTVSRGISLKLRDIPKLQSLVRKLLEAGTNRIDSTTFSVSEPRKYRDQARTLALKAAREKAIAMASVLDQKIGRPIRIIESNARALSSSLTSNMSANAQVQESEGEPADLESGAVAPGTVTVSAVLNVEFELE